MAVWYKVGYSMAECGIRWVIVWQSGIRWVIAWQCGI